MLLPGYWQSNFYPTDYWQVSSQYWPHWPAAPPAPARRGGSRNWEYPDILECIFLDEDEDEILFML